MLDRKTLLRALAVALVVALGPWGAPLLHAEYSNIKFTDLFRSINSQTIAAGESFTQVPAYTALGQTINHAVQIKGTGTLPHYKVEMLVTLDGTRYVKPEVGGDLGEFDDEDYHIIAVSTPVCVGHKLKVTELSTSNPITIDAWERSQ